MLPSLLSHSLFYVCLHINACESKQSLLHGFFFLFSFVVINEYYWNLHHFFDRVGSCKRPCTVPMG